MVASKKATGELREEHEGIELMLQILKVISDKLKNDESIDFDQMDDILEFLSVFVDKCHHAKEEEFLFPALRTNEASLDGLLIDELLADHKQGRKYVKRLGNITKAHKNGARVNVLTTYVTIDEYVELMTKHIEKENTALFPAADTEIDLDKDKELIKAFDKLEQERIGEGKHDEFHLLLHKLRDIYLK